VALIFFVSSTGRWSSHNTTLWSFPDLSKWGAVTETGSSVSWVKTAREQVASKPMPRIEFESTLFWVTARRTEAQMLRQMSFVDCSYNNDGLSAQKSQRRRGETHVIAGLRLPETNVLGGEAHNITNFVDDARPCASCANINADIMVHLDMNFVPNIEGALSGRRPDSAPRN